MTREEVLRMPAGQQMDGEIAIHVLGWTYVPDRPLRKWYNPKNGERYFSPPEASTSRGVAIDILKETGEDFTLTFIASEGRWKAQNIFGVEATADTEALAICRALLLGHCKE